MIFLLLFFLSACSSPEPTQFSGTAMTIDWRVVIGQTLTTQEEEKISQAILATFDEVDRRFNRYNPESEISKLNASTTFECSEELYSLLMLAGQVVKQSGGAFDPTVLPLQLAWTEALNNGHVLENLDFPEVGWDNLSFNGRTVTKRHPKTALDLGGIAKGHAIDLLIERISALGYPNLLVEWGGEMAARGVHPTGRPWTIAIPFTNEVVPLANQAVASSGDYYQFWEVGEKRYTHIIDPRTKQPVVKRRGSTVIAPTCAYADALATALMLTEITPEPALVFWLSPYSKSE